MLELFICNKRLQLKQFHGLEDRKNINRKIIVEIPKTRCESNLSEIVAETMARISNRAAESTVFFDGCPTITYNERVQTLIGCLRFIVASAPKLHFYPKSSSYITYMLLCTTFFLLLYFIFHIYYRILSKFDMLTNSNINAYKNLNILYEKN